MNAAVQTSPGQSPRALPSHITQLSECLSTAGNLLCQIEDGVERMAGSVPAAEAKVTPRAVPPLGHLGDLQAQIENAQALSYRLSNLADRINNLV